MDRREFLRRALSLAPALVVVPAAVTYFLPPTTGWPRLLTPAQIANEALLRLGFISRTDWKRGWDEIRARGVLDELQHDMVAFGTAIARVVPGDVERIPPHQWFKLEVENG